MRARAGRRYEREREGEEVRKRENVRGTRVQERADRRAGREARSRERETERGNECKREGRRTASYRSSLLLHRLPDGTGQGGGVGFKEDMP
ncbi:Hypothetical protein NTJ_15487 [Nesidiocoris tenuis]|uniref:Uncharacterized protein n=1 Tax=Nesidiocoris tenuis TaxID=355587 RepID=A0ABN7BE73_9HEMI|nr:Hypothetical protein NTJ_15487 [Nesidiocoris tenuis]